MAPKFSNSSGIVPERLQEVSDNDSSVAAVVIYKTVNNI